MKKIRDMFSPYNRERGSGELVVTLFSIPLLAGLLFTLINVSSYFQTRSAVQDVARDGARLVALYGGSTTAAYRNTTGENVAVTVQKRLYKDGKCILSHCTKPPVVTCNVVVNGIPRAVATDAGQVAVCNVQYWYSSVAPSWFGFDKLVTVPITIDATTVTETGYR